MTLDRARVEAEFAALQGAIYLDAASIGPLPASARAAVQDLDDRRAATHRLRADDFVPLLARARTLAATLLGAAPDEIALATNTSYGLNVAALALPLGPGDVVVLSDGEFPANVYPWLTLEERGVTVEIVPVTPEGWPDEARLLARLRDPRVKVLTVSLVQFHTGWLADLAALSAATRATGTLLVVDAIQGLGHVPVDLGATPVDVLASGAQKWLLSPWGSGFVYVRRDLQPLLRQATGGWTAFAGTDDLGDLCRYERAPRADARRFELLTLPLQAFAGMTRSLELLLALGVPAIGAHVAALCGLVHDWARAKGVRLASPVGDRQAGIVALDVPAAAEAARALRAGGVVASVREGWLRFSPHLYNTPEQLRHALALLERCLA